MKRFFSAREMPIDTDELEVSRFLSLTGADEIHRAMNKSLIPSRSWPGEKKMRQHRTKRSVRSGDFAQQTRSIVGPNRNELESHAITSTFAFSTARSSFPFLLFFFDFLSSSFVVEKDVGRRRRFVCNEIGVVH